MLDRHHASRYSDWLRAGRSRDRIPVGARFSAPVQTGPGAQPAPCTMGTGSFSGVKNGRGVTLIPHPLPVPWSRKSRTIPLLPLWAVRPVQSFSACTRVHFTFPNCTVRCSVLHRVSHHNQPQFEELQPLILANSRDSKKFKPQTGNSADVLAQS
jgi:DNA-binding transcriptional LysR family regulator